jgi:hypothetical protein
MAFVKLEHRLGIQAPADAIWAVIADVPAWSEWNPLYPKAEGAIRIGSPLTLELALPGQAPRAIQPVIKDWVPNEQLHWRLRLMGGLVKTTRYIEIEQLTETACIFSNGELFEGMIGPMMARRMRGPIRAGFAAMGEAVKARVEARWRKGPIALTLEP